MLTTKERCHLLNLGKPAALCPAPSPLQAQHAMAVVHFQGVDPSNMVLLVSAFTWVCLHASPPWSLLLRMACLPHLSPGCSKLDLLTASSAKHPL